MREPLRDKERLNHIMEAIQHIDELWSVIQDDIPTLKRQIEEIR